MIAQSMRSPIVSQVLRFAGVGVVSTVLHLSLFAALAGAGVGSQLANGAALVVATVVNTAMNRSWTFGVEGRARLVTQHGQALLIFAVTWVATTAALALLATAAPAAGVLTQTAVVAVANALSTAVRFIAMRHWIFHREAS